MNDNPRFKAIYLILITLVSVLGGYLIFHATNWGLWAFSDSSAYLSAARNIQAGNGSVILNSNGFFTPVTEFPPFFPFIVSLLTPLTGDFLFTARWIAIISFVICVFIAGFLSYKALDNPIAGFFSSLLIALSPLMVDTFSGFMSESLFIGLLLVLVFLLFEFFNSGKNIFLVPIFIISSFMPITRYAGILFVFVVSLCFHIFRKKYSQKAIRVIPSYLFFSLAPISIWFINQYNDLNKVGGKRFFFGIDQVKNIFQTVLQEFRIITGWLPYSGIYSNAIISNAILIFFLVLFCISLAVGLYATIKKGLDDNDKSLLLFQICLLFTSSYIFFIGLTHNLTKPSIDIIDRMMAPIYPFLLLILIYGFVTIWRKKKTWLLGSTIIIATLFFTRFYFLSTLASVEELHENGKGFTSRQYQESEFLENIKSIPTNQQMVSNSAAFVLYHSNRYPLPVKQFHNRTFGLGDAYGEKTFRERKAALIILFPEFHNYYGENSDQLLQSLTAGLRVDFLDEIGGIYYYPEPPIQQ